MNYLQDCFQMAKEISQSKEKAASAVEKQCRRIDTLIRPSLTAEQNESLSVILKEIISAMAESSFNIGYNSALQVIAETAAVSEPMGIPGQPQQDLG